MKVSKIYICVWIKPKIMRNTGKVYKSFLSIRMSIIDKILF